VKFGHADKQKKNASRKAREDVSMGKHLLPAVKKVSHKRKRSRVFARVMGFL